MKGGHHVQNNYIWSRLKPTYFLIFLLTFSAFSVSQRLQKMHDQMLFELEDSRFVILNHLTRHLISFLQRRGLSILCCSTQRLIELQNFLIEAWPLIRHVSKYLNKTLEFGQKRVVLNQRSLATPICSFHLHTFKPMFFTIIRSLRCRKSKYFN